MPFEPLTPKEQEQFKPPCNHPEHNPPTHMVIREPMKWVCPGCGAKIIVTSPIVRW